MRPLAGVRVVVTRAREQAGELVRLLEESGATVLPFPQIETAPPASFDSLDRAILEPFDWVIFTSVNGVNAFVDRARTLGRPLRPEAKVAAVGSATADALRRFDIQPDLMPERFLASEMVPLLPSDQRGIRTAVIRAEVGSEELPEALRERGGEVHLAIAYRTVAARFDALAFGRLVAQGGVDVVTFTSPSTARHLLTRLDEETRATLLASARFVAIGETTRAALARTAKEPEAVAENSTMEALVEACVRVVSV